MKSRYTPIPERLASLKPPTQAQITELAERRMRMAGTALRFEDSPEAQRTTLMPAVREQHRAAWQKQRQEALDGAKLTLTDAYERDMVQLKAIEEENAAALEAETVVLKAGYLNAGGTETEFAAALPSLLEERRRQAAVNAVAEREAQIQQALRNPAYA